MKPKNTNEAETDFDPRSGGSSSNDEALSSGGGAEVERRRSGVPSRRLPAAEHKERERQSSARAPPPPEEPHRALRERTSQNFTKHQQQRILGVSLVGVKLLVFVALAHQTKAPSPGWRWEELSVPSSLFDDHVSNDALILAVCFPLRDETGPGRRATGRIIKTLRREEPRSSLETAHDNFLTDQRREHDRAGGGGIEEESEGISRSSGETAKSREKKKKMKS
ncbi:hypothetical protein EYF80_037928 [Liparis tanakae]|uniref:Uncharacterized protein n=1 Tax=Liparis tanakae TaxID=230148 RepID=A0A4Z2GGN6_9TELE|nr:hypothetical protein EYF80_037928 [Liparis tanakae]